MVHSEITHALHKNFYLLELFLVQKLIIDNNNVDWSSDFVYDIL